MPFSMMPLPQFSVFDAASYAFITFRLLRRRFRLRRRLIAPAVTPLFSWPSLRRFHAALRGCLPRHYVFDGASAMRGEKTDDRPCRCHRHYYVSLSAGCRFRYCRRYFDADYHIIFDILMPFRLTPLRLRLHLSDCFSLSLLFTSVFFHYHFR